MGSTWSHPELGDFEFDGMAWVKNVDAPGFDAFTYDSESSEYELAFEADDEDDVPSAEAVALALKVLANHARLVPKITAALWDDINGRGPDSGMWWHGDLDQVADAMAIEEFAPPKKADDLLALISCSQIVVRKDAEGYANPIVELDFCAAFEEEHGVGVLTDGNTILGVGYQIDVAPYEAEVDAGDED